MFDVKTVFIAGLFGAHATDEARQLARGTAILVTSLAHAVGKEDPDFKERLLDSLNQAHSQLRNNPGDNDEMGVAMITYTRTLITGFNFVHGQGVPFLRI